MQTHSRIPARRPLLIAAGIGTVALILGLFCLCLGPAEAMKFTLAVPVLGMAAEAVLVRPRHEVRKDAAAAVSGGDIQQAPDGRAGYYPGLNSAASGDKINLITEGQVTVPKTSGLDILDGGPVYWDHSANKAHYKKVNDRDFFLGTAVGDAANADTEMVVNLNVAPRYLVDLARDPFDTALVGAAGSPSMRMQGGAVRMAFDTTAEAQKIDALSKDGFAIGANAIVEGQIEIVDNGDAAALDFNVGVADGTHASDADSISESVFIHVDGNALDLLAESDDGTNEVNATDTTVDYAEGTRFEFWLDLRDPADVAIYIDGSQVLSGSTFNVSDGSGPLKLLAHLEKSSNDTPGEVHIDALRVRIQE